MEDGLVSTCFGVIVTEPILNTEEISSFSTVPFSFFSSTGAMLVTSELHTICPLLEVCFKLSNSSSVFEFFSTLTGGMSKTKFNFRGGSNVGKDNGFSKVLISNLVFSSCMIFCRFS
ncbi:hypothetical protein V8G54_017533 [Vigna mungo]|uniref:Uncharacterized protein n=1 Tax=Vigna mungo TaxID=3915 RepID=A0AAQ3NPY3_VIGMU